MEAVFGESPFLGALKGAGVQQYHDADGPDGEIVLHAGDVEKCPERQCRWPRLREMVTVTSGGRQVTGTLAAREGSDGRGLVVHTADGMVHHAPLVTAQRPEWGVYCPHGVKLIEAEPAEHTCHLPPPPCDMPDEPGHLCADHRWCKACYPDGRKVSPWPCTEEGCTEADFDRERQEQIDAYHEEMSRSYYG
jgi:hypothetical protein